MILLWLLWLGVADGNECDARASECTDPVAELHRELTALHTRDCHSTASRRLLYTFWNGGLGAELHAMSLALTLAFMSNRTLVTQRGAAWVYVDSANARPADDGVGDEAVYFEPVSRGCAAPSAEQWNSTAWWRGGAFEHGQLKWAADGNDAEPALLFTSQISPDPWLLRTALPERFAARGLLWWRSALIAWLFRPRAELQALIDREWAQLGIGAAPGELAPLADCVAIHIRRGDKQREDATHADVGAYIEAARAFGRGHIVLASDDPDILARDDWPADVHVLRQAVFDRGGFDQSRLAHAHYNRTAAAHATIRDVALLAKCAASVGTMSSNLSRLVHELQTAALGRAAPFSSLSLHHKAWWVFP